MRQTIKEIEVNVVYKCFIGYSLIEPVPHDVWKKLISQIRWHKYFWADEAEKSGYVDASAIFIDSVKVTNPITEFEDEINRNDFLKVKNNLFSIRLMKLRRKTVQLPRTADFSSKANANDVLLTAVRQLRLCFRASWISQKFAIMPMGDEYA